MKDFDRRLKALENKGSIINNLAAFVVWHANGCNPSARWDPVFKKQMEELAKDISCTSDH